MGVFSSLPHAVRAGMVKLADTRDLGSRAVRRVGSSPTTRTKFRYFLDIFYILFFRFIRQSRSVQIKIYYF